MAVKIKLKRMGKIREPYFRIVVADARTKRDGRAIEEIGKYHPKAEPSFIEVNSERAQHWLSVGAQPTDPVRKILEVTGDWQKFKGLPGAEGTLQTAAARAGKEEAFAAALAETVKTLKESESATKGKARAGGERPSRAKAGDTKPGDAKAGEAKAGDAKTAGAKADDGAKTDGAKTGAAKADKPVRTRSARAAKAAETAAVEAEPATAEAEPATAEAEPAAEVEPAAAEAEAEPAAAAEAEPAAAAAAPAEPEADEPGGEG